MISFDLKKIIRQIASFYDTKIEFSTKDGYAGVNLTSRVITLPDLDHSSQSFTLSALFHELGHLLCRDHGKYKIYHKGFSEISNSEIFEFKKTAFRAEYYADIQGENLAKEWFPDLKYRKSYRDERDKKWLKRYWGRLL